MRLAVWNCNMALDRAGKLAALEALPPDIAIIPECPSPACMAARSPKVTLPSGVWRGQNPHKGLAVFAWGSWKVRLDDGVSPDIRYIAPVHVTGPTPFRLLAVWAFNRGDNFDSE